MTRRAAALPYLCTLLTTCGLALAQPVAFPAGSGVIDITQPPYNAVGDGVTDNTAAFQAAINDHVDDWRIIYIPDGVYLFNDKLNWGRGDGGGFPFGHALRLQGQSQAGTILRLAPNAPFFQNNYDANCNGVADEPKVFLDLYQPLWNTGSTPPWRDCLGGNTANAFGNEIHDLTVEISDGNPGATAIEFQSSNFGSMRNVTVRALSPTTGRTGINVAFEFPGPFLLKNITIDGFDTAIVGAPQEYSVTIHNLTTLNQRTRAVYVWRLPIQIQNWTHTGPAPALFSDSNPGAWGHVVIDNAVFTGNGATQPAVTSAAGAGSLFLRNVTVNGYPSAISDPSAGPGVPTSTPAGVIDRYCSDASFSLTGTGGLSHNWLNLPQTDAAVPSPPLAQWASVTAFGAVANDNLDDTAAIQAAMNSGASVVYFPTGNYAISDTIAVGPAVQRIVGLKSNLAIWSGLWMRAAPVFRVPGTQPVVVIESFRPGSAYGTGSTHFVEQAAPNTVLLRDLEFSGFRNSVGGGLTILENVVTNDHVYDAQTVIARQLNPEGSGTKVINRAGDVSLLGVKTEGVGAMVHTTHGGRTEVLGGLSYPSQTIPDRTLPMFLVDDASLTASMPESCYVFEGFHNVWVRETRGIATTELLNAAMTRGHANCGRQMPAYNSTYADTTPPPAPDAPTPASTTTSSITLQWPAVVDPESPIARYELQRDGINIGATRDTTFTDAGLTAGLGGGYRIRAVNAAGLRSDWSLTALAAPAADTTPPQVLLARADTPTRVLITFSEPMALIPASSPASYAIPGTTVSSAALAADGRSVTLTTSPLPLNTALTLTISGLTDRGAPANALPTTQRTITAGPTGGGTGLTAEYFASRTLSGAPAFTRTDPTVNFNYGTSPPPGAPAGFPADNFSVRWSGRITPRFSETYTISARSDDGTRVWVDGRLIVRNWFDQGPTERSGTIELVAGRAYDIVVEYYENLGGAIVELFWQSASQAREIIPASQFDPRPILRTLRTSQGAGADTNLSKCCDTDNGASTGMGAYFDPFDFFFDTAPLVRLDLSTINLQGRSIDDAVFTATLGGSGAGSGVRVMQIFGLRQSAAADNWTETGPGFVTWRSIPGVTNTAQHADPASWVYLGQMIVDNAGFQLNTQPDALALRSQALLDWLRTDTDGRVTLLIKRATPSTEGTPLFTKEADPTRAPALKLALRCRADANNNGQVNIDDIFIFLNLWFAGCLTPGTPACNNADFSADFNASGQVNIDDIFIFLNAWFAGCP